MAGPWLFVIAKKAGRFFDLDEGRVEVTVKNFLELVKNRKIAQVPKWGGEKGIKKYWNEIEEGDELFFYSGDEGAGIIGYAKIAKKRDDRWLELDFNSVMDKCRALNPENHRITAPVVREWVRFLHGTVFDLSPFENELRALLPWGHPARPGTSSSVAPTSRRGRR